MPPKPWQTKPKAISPDLPSQIASNNINTATPAIQINNQNNIGTNNNTTSINTGQTLNNNINSISTSGYGGIGGVGGYGGYGSGMGYGGGYGSSMGYGGYGSSMGYGGYGGMSSYGGYGMGGMGYGRYGGMYNQGNQPPQGNLLKILSYLQSIGFIVNLLGQISRNVEMNAQGIGRFYNSVKSLIFRIKDAIFQFFQWCKNKFSNTIHNAITFITNFIQQKLFGQQQKDQRSKIAGIKKLLILCGVVFSISLLPILKKKQLTKI